MAIVYRRNAMLSITMVSTVALLMLSGCEDTAHTTTLDSDNYYSSEERIAVLSSVINAKSPIFDTHFELFNVNGFTKNPRTIPGASSWDYRFVIKVNPGDVDLWIGDRVKMEVQWDAPWAGAIIAQQSKDWVLASKPEVYVWEDSHSALVVYRPEGIIFQRVVQD